MIFCRIAYDAPGKDEIRKAHYEGHRAHLRSPGSGIIQSGPIFSTDGENRKIGALIVFDADDIAQVETFSLRDPFIQHGVYDTVHIVRWDKTIG